MPRQPVSHDSTERSNEARRCGAERCRLRRRRARLPGRAVSYGQRSAAGVRDRSIRQVCEGITYGIGLLDPGEVGTTVDGAAYDVVASKARVVPHCLCDNPVQVAADDQSRELARPPAAGVGVVEILGRPARGLVVERHRREELRAVICVALGEVPGAAAMHSSPSVSLPGAAS